MRRLIQTLIVGSTFVLTAHEIDATVMSPTATGAVAEAADAQLQPRNVLRPIGGDPAVRQILTRIRADADLLRRSIAAGERSSSFQAPDVYMVDSIVEAADHLADHLDRRQVIEIDVEDVMRRGVELDAAVAERSTSQEVRNGWTRLQSDLDRLAAAYRLNWDWQRPTYSALDSAGSVYRRLTGTYQLDRSRSDDPRRVADQAIRQLGAAERSRVSRRIENRLDSPDELAIERDGRQVSLASSRAPRTTFEADGRQQVEPRQGARNVSTRATLYGDRLEVVTNGNADTDFTAIFEPLDNGQSLRVTKSLVISGLRQPIVVRSVYRRVSQTARWDVYGDGAVGTSGRSADFDAIIPDDTILVASLDEPLNGRTVRENDRITLTVREAPSAALDNAVIEGHVTSAPNALGDRGELSLAFNQIRLRNGRSSDFAGIVENVRGPNGEPISFSGENVGSDSNQKEEAIQRGAIGAAVGALIGAIAGGGKGAAIGAAIGAGGGAATVLIGDQRSSDLPRGTEFTIRSRVPSR